jgi:hypothetical protein
MPRGVSDRSACADRLMFAAHTPRFSLNFDSFLLSVLKKFHGTEQDWHRQKAIFIQHLRLYCKGKF